MPSVSAGTDAESSTSSAFADALPTLPKPPHRPTATIIAPASMILTPRLACSEDGAFQHVFDFGDVSIVLDPFTRKHGSYDLTESVQRYAIYARMRRSTSVRRSAEE